MIKFQARRIAFSTIYTRMILEVTIQHLTQLLDLLFPALSCLSTIISLLTLILQPGNLSKASLAISVSPLLTLLFP